MDIWFGSSFPIAPGGCAVTIGNFDGVHQGHNHILQRLCAEARTRNLQSVAIVFEPQPAEFFARQHGKSQPYRLTPMRDKIRLLAETNCLDAVWVQRFNPQFAAMRAEAFIQQHLLQRLNTKFLLVGDDFRFGQNRQGDFDLLLKQPEFITENTPSILISGSRASSTAVREALVAGRIDVAEQILGHRYTLSGHVKHGAKLGRTLGCPTANIQLSAHRYALTGVFVVEVSGSFGMRQGVASFGKNPTVSHSEMAKLEVHLFDFSGNLYGERLTVSFLYKLRDEQKFVDLIELQTAIAQDMAAARHWLNEFQAA